MLTITSEEILLVGDFNEHLDKEADRILSIAGKFGLINMMSFRHTEALPVTFARGRKCLDYGFASDYVVHTLMRCGYESFNARFPTGDHRSYFYDFDTEKLFGASNPELETANKRILQSSNVPQVTQYIEIKYDYLKQCNVFEQAQQLRLTGDCHRFAERLDRDMIIQASLLMAEKRTGRYGEPAWSVALDQA